MKKKNCQILSSRMNSLFPNNRLTYNHSSFSESVTYFDHLDKDDDAVLAVIDPPGYSQIPFKDIQRILEFPAVDMFLTVMTSGIQRNIEKRDSFDSITTFYGDEGWSEFGDAENIVNEYKSKLESNTDKRIERISIDMENQKLYDLFYISRNPNAIRIMDDIASKLKEVTLNDLISIVSKQLPDVKTLLDY